MNRFEKMIKRISVVSFAVIFALCFADYSVLHVSAAEVTELYVQVPEENAEDSVEESAEESTEETPEESEEESTEETPEESTEESTEETPEESEEESTEETPEESTEESTEETTEFPENLKALQDRINALPTVEESAQMTGEMAEGTGMTVAQYNVYLETCALYEEYDALPMEEKAQIDISKVEALLSYFNGIINLYSTQAMIHTHTDGKVFQEWPAGNNFSASGYYYLTRDVKLTSELTISGLNVSICLNGHTLDLGGYCINLKDNATLSIYDEADGKIINGKGRTEGTSTNKKGGAIYVKASTLNIYGGSIEQNQADYGAAIFIDNATVNMYGGTIQKNTARYGGGGIEIEDDYAVFNMLGGSIIYNTVTAPADSMHKGGGVHFNKGKMTVQGMVNISGNKVGNTESNVYLRANGVTLTVSGLNDGSRIGVSAQVIEKNISSYTAITNTGIDSKNMNYFFMDGTHDKTQYALIYSNQQLQIKQHKHSWRYRPGDSADTLYAYCTESTPQCQYYGETNELLPLTIKAQGSLIYNGNAFNGAKLDAAQLSAFNAATGNNLNDTSIVYYTDANLTMQTTTANGASAPGQAPKNAGTYYAAIGVNGVTAKVQFTIEKAPVTTVTAPTARTGITYNGSAQSLINAGTANGGKIQYQIAADENALLDNSWTDTIPTAADAGSYRVYYRIVADSNHEVNTAQAYEYVTTDIAKAVPTYTEPAANSLTYNGKSQQLMTTAGVTNCGTIMYSLDNKVWKTDISEIVGTNAGSYTVYWKLVGDSNHEDVQEQPVKVTIQKAKPVTGTIGNCIILSGDSLNSNVGFDGYTMKGVDGAVLPGTFIWKDGTIIPSAGETQTAIFKPADTTNYEEIEVTVTVQMYYLPTGKITVEDRTWDKLLEAISFGIYHTKQQEITIEGAVNEKGGYAIDKIYYYIDTTGSTNVLSADDLKDKWLEYDGNRKPVIAAQSNNVIYAKITDEGGNAIILCSNGIVIDGMAPVINGIENDGKYCESVTVTVTDKNLDKVTLDGTEVTLTDGEFTIFADNNTHTIKATDAAGNATEYTVTVYKEHDFTNSKGTEISRDGNVITEEFLCAHGCGEKFTRKRTAEGDVISEEYPKDGGSGSNESLATGITTEKPGTPEAKISGLDIAVVKEIKEIKGKLNASEISQVENGETLLVYLEINKVEEKDVTAEDQAKTEEQAAEKKLQQGIYLDMAMWKKIGSADAERLGSTQISKKVKITLTLPEELKAPAGKERTYYVIRVHDGVAEVLDTQLDGSDISFMTDRFSTYSIWYEEKDMQTPSGGNDNPSGQPGDSGKPNTPGTSGDSDRPNTPGSTGSSEKPDTSNSGKTDSSGNPDVSNSQNSNNTGNISAPKTGDESNMVLWSMLLLVSAVALAEVTAKRKRG